ncbi:Lrp/AsnC family transcriptional regulator [Neptunomonas qingdaonensis]|uniref:Lrp/AsnC family transcriptional regulator, leucine-responsive regulatory protein n=1 Tax=Neptunomonas qingdaonensis TaxID=1045558 RepID=A0A1I2QSN8_9GAMM|nr:Lrp/AsnC family transcriptional regulator [Neptunomonas qingdaonensis]SFG31615.1 Lrp/AsnC family transcriptional regulator, leucine-responsive regulatory protein [Neptunomonas qingdaonensis]
MDKMDLKIAALLQHDGRLTNVELADKIGLSPSPCLRRVKKLEDESVITGYYAALDRQQIGLGMTIFVDVSLDNHRDEASVQFEQAILEMNNVISCFVVSGASDYRLEVVVSDLLSYEAWLKTLQRLSVVKDIQSNFAIRAVKTRAPLPIRY